MKTAKSPNISALVCRLSISIIALSPLPAISELASPSGEMLPSPPPGYVWRSEPDLSDEFNEPQLDTNKWLPYFPNWMGRIPSCFERANVSVRDGKLEIKSTLIYSNTLSITNSMKEVWIDTGCVSSKSGSAFYGYYEARVKCSALSMSSVFWLQGHYSEIDVAEQFGASAKYPEKRMLMLTHTHYFKNGWTNDVSKGVSWEMPTDASSDYHVYGVWWKNKNTAWFYHNGCKVSVLHFGGTFQEPMHVYFDAEADFNAGLPSAESLNDSTKNTMYVDWVRSWSLIKTNIILAPASSN